MSTTPPGSAPAPDPAPEPDPVVQPADDDAGARRRFGPWVFALAVIVLAADQLTKWWAMSTLAGNDAPVSLVGELLQLRLLFNSGAAFSIATGQTWVLTIVVTVVVIVILRTVRRIGSRGWAVALGLLLGGALGNLGDRLFREPSFGQGHVVDFIDYAGFFVGNVADIAIVAAAILIAVLALRGIALDGTRHTDTGRVGAHAQES